MVLVHGIKNGWTGQEWFLVFQRGYTFVMVHTCKDKYITVPTSYMNYTFLTKQTEVRKTNYTAIQTSTSNLAKSNFLWYYHIELHSITFSKFLKIYNLEFAVSCFRWRQNRSSRRNWPPNYIHCAWLVSLARRSY